MLTNFHADDDIAIEHIKDTVILGCHATHEMLGSEKMKRQRHHYHNNNERKKCAGFIKENGDYANGMFSI